MGNSALDSGILLPDDQELVLDSDGLDDAFFAQDVYDGLPLSEDEQMALVDQELAELTLPQVAPQANLPGMQSVSRRGFLETCSRGAITVASIAAFFNVSETEAAKLPMPPETAKGRTPAARVKERKDANLKPEVKMQAALNYMDPVAWDTAEWRAWAKKMKEVLKSCYDARKPADWIAMRNNSAWKNSRKSFEAECTAYGGVYTSVTADGFPEEIEGKSGLTRFHVFRPESKITSGNKPNKRLSEKNRKTTFLLRRSVIAKEHDAFAIDISQKVDPRFTGRVLKHYIDGLVAAG